MTGVLEGVRVLEYAQYVAGPLCGQLLADMGASVIKVEPPAGDAYRRLDPVAVGLSRFFVSLNRGKRSVVIDLKSDEGRRMSSALLRTADVVVHNFAPERARSFGLDFGTVSALKPDAVVCAIESFGAAGPLAGKPAYDLIAQAHSGLLMAGARPGDVVPMRAGGIPMSDITAGLLAATGALGALHRARTTGAGEQVHVSLLTAAMAVQLQDLVAFGGADPEDPPRPASRADLGDRAQLAAREHELIPYYRCYEASDGFLAVACLNLQQRRAFLAVLGQRDASVVNPDALPDDVSELHRRRKLTHTIEAHFGSRRVDEWIAVLEEAGVPCGPVQSRDSLPGDPQVRASGLLETTPHAGVGDVRHLGPLLTFERFGDSAAGPAPALGEGNEEILGALLAEANKERA